MPRYSGNGSICELGLERRHYSPELIRLDSGLSRKDIDQISEELVPSDERGPRSKDFGGREMITVSSPSITTSIDFENVSIQIFSQELPEPNRQKLAEGDIVAATVHWKNRECR